MKNNTTLDFIEFRNKIYFKLSVNHQAIFDRVSNKTRNQTTTIINPGLFLMNLKSQFLSPAFFGIREGVFCEVYKNQMEQILNKQANLFAESIYMNEKKTPTLDFNEFRNEISVNHRKLKKPGFFLITLKTQFRSPAFFNVIKSVFNEVYKTQNE